MSLPGDVHRLLPAFLAAAEQQSFTAAARQLGITPAAISKSIRLLEQRLGRILFTRNTHYVVLTEEGMALRDQVAPLWSALGQALASPHSEPEGLVRVSVIPGFGRYRLVPVLHEFQQQYPLVRFDLAMDPRRVNLIGERIDVAIGQNLGHDDRIVSRPLQAMQQQMVASPAYLAEKGVPQTPEDLRHHRCLVHRNTGNGKLQRWLDDRWQPDEQQAWLIASHPDVLVDAAINGMGIITLADWYLTPHIASGTLVPVLKNAWPAALPLSVRYVDHRLAPRVRVFVEFLLRKFSA
ncbi:LysR family transcriptional regulator [Yokenella regensburgei]|uniref:LysR family transcriptional regulator n=1 Tax=Yokenella regensburgei TaxID=158877 RepID=UPI0013760F13|nr:LysR family transcriptional regulator [Yokenella regensburgei]KAF1370670.1 DNA-binding transcriptional LysR family regulator [Yokenella regensburgei]